MTPLRPNEYVPFGVMLAFGVWFIVFPRSVIWFYTVCGGYRRMPSGFVVRAIGALWVGSLLVITFFFAKK
jgi:hypothetical protein